MGAALSPRPQGTGPLPERIPPMLARPVPEPFDSPDHLFEVEWDGIRAIARIEGRRARLLTRNMVDVTASFPEIAASLLETVREDGVVLDGELVSLDDKGIPRLPRVMQRVHHGKRVGDRIPATFEAFDLLYRGYRDLTREPLERRKEALAAMLSPDDRVHLCHFEVEMGVAFFEAASSLGLEGMVAKERRSLYLPGQRARSWLKVKTHRTATLAVGGYTVGDGQRRQAFESLLLGAYQEDGGLRYLGSVVGGFQHDDLDVLSSRVRELHRESCPFTAPPLVGRLLYWCEPLLVVQVKYAEVEASGRLRFPIYMSLRPDVEPAECTVAALLEE